MSTRSGQRWSMCFARDGPGRDGRLMMTETYKHGAGDAGQRRACIIALHGLDHASRMFKQADALRAAGFDVTMLGIVTRHDHPLVEEHRFGRVVRVRTTKRLHSETVDPGQGGTGTGRPSPARRPFGMRMLIGRVKDNVLLARTALKSCPDVLIASDVTTWVAGYLVRRLGHAALVLDVRDLVLDSGAELPRAYRWFLGRIERSVIRRGDAVTTVSQAAADVLMARYPRAPQVHAIYSGAFDRVDRAEPAHQPLRLYFQGNFAANRRLDELVRALALIEPDEATLVLQGFGQQEATLKALVAELGCPDRVSFVPPCGRREVVSAASEYDVGIINYRGDTLNLLVAAPVKLIDYMAAGLAVLASDLPGIRGIIDEEGFGVLFAPTGEQALAAAIRQLAAAPQDVTRMKEAAIGASPRYLASVQGERFAAVVDSAIACREA